MTDHPMQPPPEQFGEWLSEACRQTPTKPGQIAAHVANRAYAAGADAQLEACVEWLEQQSLCGHRDLIPQLRAAMRPKPASLKERAIKGLDEIGNHYLGPGSAGLINTIRKALEQLPDDI